MPFYRCAMPSSSGGGGGGEIPNDGILLEVDSNITMANRTTLLHAQFNRPITIGSQTTNASYILNGKGFFNQPVNFLGNNLIDLNYFFNGCANFNQPINIPESVQYMSWTFSMCRLAFNQPINLPPNLLTAVNLFTGCNFFNQPINIPGSVIDASNMFSTCGNFNQPVNIGNGVQNVSNLFRSTKLFNQRVTIPNSVTDIKEMFAASNYNGRVDFPTNPSNYISMYNLFISDAWFDKPVILTKSNNLGNTFAAMTRFNSPVLVRGSYDSGCPLGLFFMYNMFYASYNFHSTVIFDLDLSNAVITDERWPKSCIPVNSKRTYTSPVTVYAKDQLFDYIINPASTKGYFFDTAITWSAITNGYFNSQYNFYVYNNVSDGKNWFNNYWHNIYGEYPNYN